MQDYIRNAFKSLEDLNVIIEPKATKLKEAVEEEENVDSLTIRELFEKESSYIVTHDFESSGHSYSLFLEALNDGESCDILFEEFDINNVTEVLAEVLDSEHEFIGSLTGENINLDTTIAEAVSKADSVIMGEESTEENSEEESEEDSNERVFINGDPDMKSEEGEDVIPEKEIQEESLKEEKLTESEKLNLNNKEDIDKAEKVLNQKDKESIEQIVDVSAETKNDLKKSYVGSAILQCQTCKTLIYKDPDQLVEDEGDEHLYNVEDECPHCGAKDGYTLIGQVASLDVDPFKEPVPPMVEEEPKAEEPEIEIKDEEEAEIKPEEAHEELETPKEEAEEGKPSEEEEKKEDDKVEDKEEKEEESKEQPLNEEHCEIKLTTEEKNMLDKLTHGNKMDCWFAFGDDDETIIDLEDNNKPMDTCEAILTVADGTVDIENFLTPEEIELFNKLVERCKECKGEVKEECENCEKSDKEEKKDTEIKLESLDETKFDKLVTRYLKETYSNVKSYNTTHSELNNDENKVLVEGTINFKSGKQKPTKFVFEAKAMTAKGQLKLVGINEMFSAGKSFTLTGGVSENKLLSESLAYRYETEGKKVHGKATSFKKR